MTFDLEAYRREYNARFLVRERRGARDLRQVYCLGPGAGLPVKIGIATDPAARLIITRNWHWEPMQLYWTLPGTFFHEAALHRALSARRIHHEWFRDADDLIKAAPICGGTETETERMIVWLSHRLRPEVDP